MAKPKKLVLVLGDKGGTFKSGVTQLLWGKMRHAHPSARAFDADGTTGSFVRIFGSYDANGNLLAEQPPEGVTPIFLHGDERDRDQIIRTVQTDADLVLVDMPATSLTVLERLEADWGFMAEVGRSGYKVVAVNVVTPFVPSLGNVLKTFALMPGAENVVILNEFFGKPSAWYRWYGDERRKVPESKGRQKLLERGGIELILPACATDPLVFADSETLPFAEAVDAMRALGLEWVPDSNRLRRWLEDAYDALSPADELLGLTIPKASTNGKAIKAETVEPSEVKS